MINSNLRVMKNKKVIDIRKRGMILAKIKEEEEISNSAILIALKKIKEDGDDIGILSEAAIRSRISSNVASALRWALDV